MSNHNMSDHNMGNHKEQKSSLGATLGFEREDLSPRIIIAFLIGLAIFGLFLYFAMLGVLAVADHYTEQHQTAKSPMVPMSPETRSVTPSDVEKFPEPRLETYEPTEIFGFRTEEEKQLHSYGWVDQKTGAMHIPIERAMDLIAERGLPTTPKTGEFPPAEVNMVRSAAARSDQSGGSTGLEKTGVQNTEKGAK